MIASQQKIYIIIKPAKPRGDATKNTSVGATSWEICYFKNSLYISYGEAI